MRFISVRGQDDGLSEVVHGILELLHLEQDVSLQQKSLHVATVEDASLVGEEQGPETSIHDNRSPGTLRRVVCIPHLLYSPSSRVQYAFSPTDVGKFFPDTKMFNKVKQQIVEKIWIKWQHSIEGSRAYVHYLTDVSYVTIYSPQPSIDRLFHHAPGSFLADMAVVTHCGPRLWGIFTDRHQP